jgi:ribonuclease P protein component
MKIRTANYILTSIKNEDVFKDIFRASARFRSGALQSLIRFPKFGLTPLSIDSDTETTPTIPTLEFGIVVRKKIIRKAVLRNRVKRLLRESLRKIAQSTPELLANITMIVMTWNVAPESIKAISQSETELHLRATLADAQRFYQRKRQQLAQE